jgi:hypothetical protein|tara:strand:- start:23699 stop:23914 length:216 start_codon:yes stop_codon:yes gene_type:complete
MNPEEIDKERKALEAKILKQVKDFEDRTEMRVEEMNARFGGGHWDSGYDRINMVHLKLVVPRTLKKQKKKK